jgi:pSer/pThr/pTyr-binding forkhead associated (FHA) protein
MASSIFCPVCQRRNNVDAKRCAYCGSILQTEQSRIGMRTTVSITPSLDNLRPDASCQEYLSQISQGDICFILEKKQTPVVLRDVSEIILGRFFDDEDGTNLDLDPYGGGAFGVSRRHARIVRIDNKFVFEDLNSTNGSWLNGQRIPTDTTYPLMSGDQIWLGQFKLQVCFHQTEKIPHTILFLRDTTSPSKKLTPERLLTQIGPYLKAISDLQEIASECMRLDYRKVAVEKIDASNSDAYVVVHIVNNPEAIHLIRKWITPWRLEQQLNVEDLGEVGENKQEMAQLTSKIITDIAPDMDSETRFTVVERALPVVTQLATGPIDLSFEAF